MPAYNVRVELYKNFANHCFEFTRVSLYHTRRLELFIKGDLSVMQRHPMGLSRMEKYDPVLKNSLHHLHKPECMSIYNE